MIRRALRNVVVRPLAGLTALAFYAFAVLDDEIEDERRAHHGESIAEDEYLTGLARRSRMRGGR